MTETATATANPVADSFLACLERSKHATSPFDFWLLEKPLPDEDAASIADLPFAPPSDLVFNGRRETNNSTRVYFNPENQAKFEVCRRVVAGFRTLASAAPSRRRRRPIYRMGTFASSIARTPRAFGWSRTPTFS